MNLHQYMLKNVQKLHNLMGGCHQNITLDNKGPRGPKKKLRNFWKVPKGWEMKLSLCCLLHYEYWFQNLENGRKYASGDFGDPAV